MTYAEIPLGATRRCKHTQKYVALVDQADAGWASSLNWTADLIGGRVYAVRRVKRPDGSSFKSYMHREVWSRATGEQPVGQIDHVVHGAVIGVDNRRSNLRLANASENAANQRRRKDNTSGFRGVSWNKNAGKWESYVTHRGVRTKLGMFSDASEAAKAYDVAALERFGQFARTNFQRSP